MDGRRDVINRLGAAGIGYFVTGSEAMAVLGLAYVDRVGRVTWSANDWSG